MCIKGPDTRYVAHQAVRPGEDNLSPRTESRTFKRHHYRVMDVWVSPEELVAMTMAMIPRQSRGSFVAGPLKAYIQFTGWREPGLRPVW